MSFSIPIFFFKFLFIIISLLLNVELYVLISNYKCKKYRVNIIIVLIYMITY